MHTLAIDFRGGFDKAFANVATFVPKLLAFLVILIVGYFVAKALAAIVAKVLQRVGFDRVVERGGVKQALARSKYDAAGILGKLVYYAIFLFVLQAAFGVFGNNPISRLLTGVIAFLPLVFVAIVIVVVAAAIAAAVKELLTSMLGGLSYGPALANVAAAFVIALGVIAALNQVHVATAVTTPILIFVLATLGGILVVGVGGGLIRPMQARMERALSRAEQESSNVRDEARQSPGIREQAQESRARLSSSS